MKIQKCSDCNKYTLKKSCPVCEKETIKLGPPKYSPEDHYGEYRRRMKEYIKNG